MDRYPLLRRRRLLGSRAQDVVYHADQETFSSAASEDLRWRCAAWRHWDLCQSVAASSTKKLPSPGFEQ